MLWVAFDFFQFFSSTSQGLYKKIGVCGGRSIYQHANNTDIFMYYGCGRWFIGLEIGVCGGWLFAKSLSICIHGQHEVLKDLFLNAMIILETGNVEYD